MASEFEEELTALDARLEKAQKAAEGLVDGLKQVRRAARAGQISEIVKGLEGLDARLADAQSAARDLSGAWRFDASAYMADGRFLADLKAAAAEQKLEMFERDGRIYCFPLLLRIDANQSAVRIGRKIERRIRPSELVRLLAKAQKRPQRFREQAFLDLVWRAYRRLVGREWNGTDPGRVVRAHRHSRHPYAAAGLRLSARGIRPRSAAFGPPSGPAHARRRTFRVPSRDHDKGHQAADRLRRTGNRTGLLRRPVRPGRVKWGSRRNAWLDLIDREYLREFVSGGGSAVKFVEGEAEQLDEIQARLVALAEQHELASCRIDASQTRLHMIQDIFFAISRSLDWPAMAQAFVEALVTKQGYRWPRPGGGVTFQDLAAYNEIDVRLFRRDLNRWLTDEIMRDRSMSQDFRIAMATLCRTRLEPDETDIGVTTPVLEWLRGELRAIGASAPDLHHRQNHQAQWTGDAALAVPVAAALRAQREFASRSIFVRFYAPGCSWRGAAVLPGGGDRRLRGAAPAHRRRRDIPGPPGRRPGGRSAYRSRPQTIAQRVCRPQDAGVGRRPSGGKG